MMGGIFWLVEISGVCVVVEHGVACLMVHHYTMHS